MKIVSVKRLFAVVAAIITLGVLANAQSYGTFIPGREGHMMETGNIFNIIAENNQKKKAEKAMVVAKEKAAQNKGVVITSQEAKNVMQTFDVFKAKLEAETQYKEGFILQDLEPVAIAYNNLHKTLAGDPAQLRQIAMYVDQPINTKFVGFQASEFSMHGAGSFNKQIAETFQSFADNLKADAQWEPSKETKKK